MDMEVLQGILRMLSPFIQEGLESLIPLAVAFIAVYLRLWLLAAKREAEQRLTQGQMEMAEMIIVRLVTAAEQVYKDLDGPAKKARVIQQAQEELAEIGLVLDFKQLEAMLEAAVRRERHWAV